MRRFVLWQPRVGALSLLFVLLSAMSSKGLAQVQCCVLSPDDTEPIIVPMSISYGHYADFTIYNPSSSVVELYIYCDGAAPYTEFGGACSFDGGSYQNVGANSSLPIRVHFHAWPDWEEQSGWIELTVSNQGLAYWDQSWYEVCAVSCPEPEPASVATNGHNRQLYLSGLPIDLMPLKSTPPAPVFNNGSIAEAMLYENPALATRNRSVNRFGRSWSSRKRNVTCSLRDLIS
jgi:hypothetical protein